MTITPEQARDPRLLRLVNDVVRCADEWCNQAPQSRDLLARVARHDRMADALERLRAALAAPPGETGAALVEGDGLGVG